MGRERVTVPAGSFDTFKLDHGVCRERLGAPPIGHFWVADGGALVKAEPRDPEGGNMQRIELVKLER